MATASNLEIVSCNLCGSTKQRLVYEIPDTWYFTKEIFSVVECEYCGLGFVKTLYPPLGRNDAAYLGESS